jgi:hypothetical protein
MLLIHLTDMSSLAIARFFQEEREKFYSEFELIAKAEQDAEHVHAPSPCPAYYPVLAPDAHALLELWMVHKKIEGKLEEIDSYLKLPRQVETGLNEVKRLQKLIAAMAPRSLSEVKQESITDLTSAFEDFSIASSAWQELERKGAGHAEAFEKSLVDLYLLVNIWATSKSIAFSSMAHLMDTLMSFVNSQNNSNTLSQLFLHIKTHCGMCWSCQMAPATSGLLEACFQLDATGRCLDCLFTTLRTTDLHYSMRRLRSSVSIQEAARLLESSEINSRDTFLKLLFVM